METRPEGRADGESWYRWHTNMDLSVFSKLACQLRNEKGIAPEVEVLEVHAEGVLHGSMCLDESYM